MKTKFYVIENGENIDVEITYSEPYYTKGKTYVAAKQLSAVYTYNGTAYASITEVIHVLNKRLKR